MHRRAAIVLVAIISLLRLSASVEAQTTQGAAADPYPRVFEAFGGIGYTGVDLPAWSASVLNDWSKANYQVAGLVLPVRYGKLLVGGEVGYQYFMWYETKRTTASYGYTYDSSALRFLGIARAELAPRVFADFGAGFYRFSGFTDFGVTASLGYAIPINERLSIPIKGRLDLVLDSDTKLVPLSVVGGVSYKF